MTMKKNNAVPKEEQETVIQIGRDGDVAVVYTTDTRYINKLDKMYKRSKVYRNGRTVAAVEYRVPFKCISFRNIK